MTVLDETPTPVATRTPPHPSRRLIPRIALAIVLALLAAAPYLVTVSTILTLEQIAAFAVFAVAANLLIGQAGLVSFGQGVFFGLGAYTVTLGWEHAGLSFWEAPAPCTSR
jgi:branched-chain amino acid transport system permease protein